MTDSLPPTPSTLPAPLSLAESVELAVVTRNGFVESRHAGSAVVLSPDGSIFRHIGNPEAAILPRSALKPFQAVALMTMGITLHDAEAALAMGSHGGTPCHIDGITTMLKRTGLTPDQLQCPPTWPSDVHARHELIAANGSPSRIAMSCSGKHAAMLMACQHNGFDLTTYLNPEHPVQTHIRQIVERLSGEKVIATVTDGCGAPVHAMSLTALARGIQRIAEADNSSPFGLFRYAAQLREAALTHPWAVDGHGSVNTLVIEQLGVFAKWGAEGMMVMAAPNGTTVAVKILDGNLRAATVIALALLSQSHALTPHSVAALLPKMHLDVYGGETLVGSIRPTV